MANRAVLITGAAGRIGRAIAPLLPADWAVRRTDRSGGNGVEPLDITDLSACRQAFAGVDAVVHLAANPSPDAAFDELLSPNLVGSYAVAEAARDAGVRRLVLASSLHAMSGTPAHFQVRADDQARPGTLYGATKVWAEALGAWIAATSDTSVVALRIGFFSERRPDPATTSLSDRTAWLSARDAADLIRAAVVAEGFDYLVACGISANRQRRADLTETMSRLGYRPRDDAWAEA